MTWIPCSICGGMCLGKCAGLGNPPSIELPIGCSNCKHFADATRALDSMLRAAVIERDDLRQRVETLTAERDALQNGDAFKVENETLREKLDRAESVARQHYAEIHVLQGRLDELRRVIAELVRK
jgi:hypothetical protein